MDFAAARHNMVESQIRPNKVTDPALIGVLAALPREAFVPKALQGVAYVDEAIDLGNGRYMMEPMVVARLLQTAQVKPDDVVLDIGCGTGYSVAIVARLASTVVALESDPQLAAQTSRTLADLEIDTVTVVEGPLEQGFAEQGPYDVIFLDGAIAHIPDVICDQLAEGGRLVAVVDSGGVGRGTLVTRHDGILSRRQVFDAGTPILPGFATRATFQF